MTTPVGALFNIAKAQPLDNNGLPQAACYLNFYTTGTTSTLAVYSNATLATPISQPVTADSAGRFPAIYLDPSKTYRYQLYNAANVLLQDIDPYLPSLAQNTNTAGSFTAGSTTAPSLTVNAPASGRAVIEGIDNASGTWFIGANNGANDLVTGSSARDLVVQTPNNIILDPTGGGAIKGMGPTAGVLVDMTPDSGTFTVTLTGCTTSPTGTAKWQRVGNLVFLFLPAVTATSNANSCTMTGLPAGIQPTATPQNLQAGLFEDNTAATDTVTAQVNNGSGTITFLKSGSATGFTTSGTKGTQNTTICYMLI